MNRMIDRVLLAALLVILEGILARLLSLAAGAVLVTSMNPTPARWSLF